MQLERILLIVITTFVFTFVMTPIIKRIALHVGAMDIPNERKVHTKPIPRLGGLGIYFGFLFGYMLFGAHSIIMNAILIGSFIIILIGAIDDVKPVPARYKLAGQIVSAIIVSFYGGILLRDVSFFGIYLNFGIFSYPLTILFIVGIINCINLIDGLDGLASGISAIYFLTIAIIAILMGMPMDLEIILCLIMFGSTLGFLVHNFYPAKIFMGDSGSMFLGYIISIICLLGFKNVTMTSLIIPMLLLAIPIMDTFFAIVRRIINHKPITMPDKNHLHHQLLRLNISHRNVVLIIYLIDILFAIASIVYVLKDQILGIIIYSILFIIVFVLVLKTNIIYGDRKGKCRK